MLELYGHPFSSYSRKAPVARYEIAMPFALRSVDPERRWRFGFSPAPPSIARAVDEARAYRHYFPLGAPNRD